MTRAQWGKLTLALIIGALVLIVSSVAIIDPFEVYHKATAFIPPIESGTQSYSNAGIAKSYDYDSIIIGSSMTENFRPSQLDSLLGGRFVKLCINGGTPFNHKQMMDIAFGSHEIRRVFYGLDVGALSFFYTTPKAEMPTYLYDDNLFNDVQYWFNQSVLAKYVPKCLMTLGQTDPGQRDSMYSWGENFAYGADAVLREPIRTDEVAQRPLEEHPTLSQQSMLNIEHNFIPFIEAHPETEFIFFFPPYSLMQWYSFYTQGILNDHLMQKQAVVERLLAYDNVKLYDFQDRLDWILDLNHYVDYEHYGAHINAEIAELIASDAHRVTGTEQIRATASVLIDHVDRLRRHGAWPASFDSIPSTKGDT
ncbi:MAG: hypothetical protein E7321_08520 [Clostridiales bacterium]|nr:hypothetical protein [Clostridiales bacterium]